MHEKVIQFLNELNILYQKQFAIIKLIEDIKKPLDNVFMLSISTYC